MKNTIKDNLGNEYEVKSNDELYTIENFEGVIICSVELFPQCADDVFNGTLDECVEYCKENEYTDKVAQIVALQLDAKGSADFCYAVYDVNGELKI